jgi:hypothetical protein
LAGIILGANLFIRFPNFLGLSLGSAIWLHAWAYRRSWRDALARSLWFLGGFALGIALVWGLIVWNGHKTVYIQGIQELFDRAGDIDSGYAASGLFKRFIWDHFLAFAKALTVLLISALIAKWIGKQKKLMAAVGVFTAAFLLFFVNYLRDQWQWCIPGICYIVLLLIFSLELRKNTPLAVLAFIAGLILLLTPLGSGDGIGPAIYGTWLAIPLTLVWLWRTSDLTVSIRLKAGNDGLEANREISFEARSFRVFAMIIALALLFQVLVSSWRHTFRDSETRLAMTHSIAHPLLWGTYTTAERAKVVAELLDAMFRFTKPGDEVIAYNTITTVHFLTQTHPWLGDPWPDIAAPKDIADLILQKEKTGARLPCIVRATGSTWDNNWPIDAKPPMWGNQLKILPHMFEGFVQRHGYIVSWSNDFFEILTTTKSFK